ncbi:hypothetical protein DTL42_16095 [Bremerella cremea]|uniref:Uncharacterized protein n=1 Tax=Bremerella cremea TaxID=1031537 RepID=A0A368KPJ1_9BACT|nr:hypothetical protein [Bremerella cremea]RCS46477.1 hypothetical protein DTL42_16095 [Bremerella cremea]
MTHFDNEPVRPDRPPPTKQPEEYHEEEIRSIRNGIGGFLIAGFAMGRTLQIFSRSPGSAGSILVAAWAFAVFVQGYYLHGHTQLHGRIDAIPFELLIAAQVVWWLVGLVLTFVHILYRTQARDSDLGRGVLSCYFPRLSTTAAGIVSDVGIGLALAALLRLFASPVQSNWYLIMVGWILICHFAFFLHQWYLRKRVHAAKLRSAGWRTEVRGRRQL